MAQAQSAGVLVSNLGQADDDTTNLDNTGYHGQAFSVGADGGNYTLTSIEISTQANGIAAADIGSLSVSVWSTDSSGQPSSSLHSLTNPSSIAADATATFNAQAGATLEAGKTYAVVVYYDKTLTSDWPGWVRTGTGDDDSPATGWEIVDSSLFRVATSANWRSVPGEAHEIRVNGTAVGGTDAVHGRDAERADGDRRRHGPGDLRVGHHRLRGVGGERRRRGDGDGDDDRFRGDDRIPGRGRRDAHDADTGVTGHQVAVAGSETVIKVKVTAEDGNATQTYMVTVTRAAATCTAPDLTGQQQIWTATLTVGTTATGWGFNSTSSPPIGALSDTDFDVDLTGATNSYTFTRIEIVAPGFGTYQNSSLFDLLQPCGRPTWPADDARLVTFTFSTAVHNDALNSYSWRVPGADWSTYATRTVYLSVPAASSDATLSDLVVNDGNADLTLTPTFESGMYTYTASVVNTVAEVTTRRRATPTRRSNIWTRSPTPTPRIPAFRWRWRWARPSSR